MLKQSPTFSSIRTPSSYPASQKDLRVPYREIALSPTSHRDRMRTLHYRFTTLPGHTPTATRGSTCLADCPGFAPTGSSSVTIPRFLRRPAVSMRASVKGIY
jgi:hypothetical protein